MHPFRFGCISTGMESQKVWQEHARHVEDAGFSVLLVPDHFALPLAPVPALVAAAVATSSLRLGTYVLANDFRHPAVLAKEASTVDVLSDGRFELGIGAGWNAAEYGRAGIPYGSGAVRLARMAEAVEIIKACHSGMPVHFRGTHYTIDGLECHLKPVQSPLPLMLGGGGPQTLRFAAVHATIVSLMGAARHGAIDMHTLGEQAVRQRIGWVRAAAGDRFRQLELNLFIFRCLITDDRNAAADQIARQASVDPEMILHSPHYLLGTARQIQEQLLRIREEYTISYFAAFQQDLRDMAAVIRGMPT